jgi:hypothetical protein
MALTLEPRVPGSHYPNPDGVTRTLAVALGRTLSTTHQLLDGPTSPFARVERILTIAVHAGHTAWAATRVERLARLVRQARVPLTPQLVGRAQAADMHEDVCESKYLAAPSDETRDEWLRALDRELLELMALRDAVAGER